MWKYDLVAPKLQSKAKTRDPNPVACAKPETGYKRETRNRLQTRNAKPVATAKPETGDTFETRTRNTGRVAPAGDVEVRPGRPEAGRRVQAHGPGPPLLTLQNHCILYNILVSTIHFTKSCFPPFALQNPAFHYLLHKITLYLTKSCFPLLTLQNHDLLLEIIFPTFCSTKSCA